MNKKFSTLLASALLASTVGAYAQIVPTPEEGGFAKFLNKPTVEVNNVEKGLVQLAVEKAAGTDPKTADLVLAMIPADNGTYTLKAVSPKADSEVELRYTLWTVVADGDGVSGYNYQLQNLGTGEFLAFNSKEATAYDKEKNLTLPSAATNLGADVASWTWLLTPSLEKGNKFEEGAALSSVFKSDSVLTLVGNAAIADGSEIYAVKYSNKNVPASIANQLKIYPVAPAPFLLGVNDLNSMLWKQGADGKMQLTFNPDVKAAENKNVFTQALKAESAVGYPFRNYKWDAYKETEGSKQQDVLFCTALYNYEFYQASKAYADAITAALNIKDATVSDLEAVLSAVWAKTDTYDNGLKAAKDFDPKTNAVQAAVKTAVINFFKATKIVFNWDANTASPEYGITLNLASAKTMFAAIAKNTEGSNPTDVATAKANIVARVASWKLDDLKKAAEKERENAKTQIDAQGWVSLKTNDGKYVMVDTTYMTTAAGQKYLKLIDNAEFKDLKANSAGEALATINWTRMDINGRFNFQFVYYPNQDSLVIRSAGFATLSDQDPTKDAVSYFKDLSLTDDCRPDITKEELGTAERNLVKIAVLGNKDHRELTIGNSEYDRLMSPTNTINTRISLLDIANTYVKTTLPEGVYHFNLFTELVSRAAENGKFAIADFDGSEMEWNTPETNFAWGEVQKYVNMPRTQWVVVKNNATATSTVDIYNREYPEIHVKRVQLYKAGENVFATYWTNASTNPAWKIAKADTLAYTKLAADDKKIGYKQMKFDDKLITNYFNLRYFNGLDEGNLVEIAEDKALFVNPETEAGTRFQFVNTVNDKPYGYNNTLVRDSYKVMDKATGMYLQADGKNGYVLVEDADEATVFLFKENNGYATEDGEWVSYYALVSGSKNENVSGVKHPSLVVSVESTENENSIATFAFEDTEKYDYRRLGKTVNDGLINTSAETEGLNTVKFFRTNVENTFLYENTMNRNANNGDACLNFLGEVNLNDKPANAALPIVVDTAYVRNNTTKPLYMLAVRYNWIEEGEEVIPCPDHGYDCEHAQKVNTPAHSKAAYLVALNDSVKAYPQAKYQGNVRLAFVDAKHIADTLVIANSEFTHAVKDPAKKDSLFFADKQMNRATFAFRLVNPLEDNGDFYIEAEKDADGEPQYIRVHNSVPVLVSELDQAATFNVEATDEKSTANEGIEATGVKVVATEGAVIVKGAEGKNVVITNVLGQQIANTVVSSDEATIAVPQGVVVVAVEGEAAVKAIVK